MFSLWYLYFYYNIAPLFTMEIIHIFHDSNGICLCQIKLLSLKVLKYKQYCVLICVRSNTTYILTLNFCFIVNLVNKIVLYSYWLYQLRIIVNHNTLFWKSVRTFWKQKTKDAMHSQFVFSCYVLHHMENK